MQPDGIFLLDDAWNSINHLPHVANQSSIKEMFPNVLNSVHRAESRAYEMTLINQQST